MLKEKKGTGKRERNGQVLMQYELPKTELMGGIPISLPVSICPLSLFYCRVFGERAVAIESSISVDSVRAAHRLVAATIIIRSDTVNSTSLVACTGGCHDSQVEATPQFAG